MQIYQRCWHGLENKCKINVRLMQAWRKWQPVSLQLARDKILLYIANLIMEKGILYFPIKEQKFFIIFCWNPRHYLCKKTHTHTHTSSTKNTSMHVWCDAFFACDDFDGTPLEKGYRNVRNSCPSNSLLWSLFSLELHGDQSCAFSRHMEKRKHLPFSFCFCKSEHTGVLQDSSTNWSRELEPLSKYQESEVQATWSN